MAANGFNEMMGLSLSPDYYYKEILPLADEELVFINNTSNIHLNIMRPSMLFSGLEAILYNQNRQNADLKFFEFGRIYRQLENGQEEKEHLSVLLSGQRWNESWLYDNKVKTSYFTLKTFVQNILERLGIQKFQETAIQNELFNFGMKYHRGKYRLVEFGKVQSKITKKMDIKNEVFYADFYWENVMNALPKSDIQMEELNKFPSVRRDLALVIENSVKFSDIVSVARRTDKKTPQRNQFV